MITLDDAERQHIAPGMDVYDVDTHKLGSVRHIHERATSLRNAGGASGTGETLDSEDLIEVRTGFLGLGKHLFIPQSAVKDVTEGGVFLSVTREEVHQRGWNRRPAHLAAQALTARAQERQSSQGSASASSEAAPTTWEEALPFYRARCQQRYGVEAQWDRYETRYRFTWDMSQVPDLAARPWSEVQVELQRRWEVLHPDAEWETVRETIRDAWEQVPVSPAKSP